MRVKCRRFGDEAGIVVVLKRFCCSGGEESHRGLFVVGRGV